MLHIHIPRLSAKKLLKEHGLAYSYPDPLGRVPDSSWQFGVRVVVLPWEGEGAEMGPRASSALSSHGHLKKVVQLRWRWAGGPGWKVPAAGGVLSHSGEKRWPPPGANQP